MYLHILLINLQVNVQNLQGRIVKSRDFTEV